MGDWTLEITGWGPGTSVLLPAGLIVAIVIGWRLGANAVLSFWLAYILTRPPSERISVTGWDFRVSSRVWGWASVSPA